MRDIHKLRVAFYGPDDKVFCEAIDKRAQVYRAAPKLLAAIDDLLAQLEGVGIYTPGEDAGQWRGAEGLSFARIEAAIATARGGKEWTS